MFLLTEQRDLLENFRVPRVYSGAVASSDIYARGFLFTAPIASPSLDIFFVSVSARTCICGFRLLSSTQKIVDITSFSEIYI